MRKKFKKNRKNKDFAEIYGFHAVKAALKNNKRIHQKLIISYSHKRKIDNLEFPKNKIVFLPNEKFIKIYGSEKKHQGIVLKTSILKQPSLKDILLKSLNYKKDIFIMLDQVTDPQNIGSIMRSCALFGCNSIIVSKDNSPDITSAMSKAGSGAIEKINYIKVINLVRAIKEFKKNNFWVIGFDAKSNNSITKIQLPKKSLLVFGSEDKGLRELTKKECDQILKIPINQTNEFELESLNVSNACAIGLYEYFRMQDK